MKKIIIVGLLLTLLSGCTAYDSCIDDCLKIQYQKNCTDIINTAYDITLTTIDGDCRNTFLEMCQDKCLGAINTK